MHGYRRFCNKIYQATKFVLGKLGPDFVPRAEGSKTGHESLAERFILHKMTMAAKEINEALGTFEFSHAASIIYQFWLTQLCDVYIENSKAIIQDGSPEEQMSAKQTLYAALDGALTMIHPLMPFLTEELWQRLPRRPQDSTPSIVMAKYPTFDEAYHDPASEKAYETVLDVSRAIRSLMSQYLVKENGTIFIQIFNEASRKTCTAELASIRSLAGKGIANVSILSSNDLKPLGCLALSVNAEATIWLLAKGQVNIDQEIEKAERKREKANLMVKKQKAILDDESYKSKVSEQLQESERKKLRDAEAEVKLMQESIQQFEQLKLV